MASRRSTSIDTTVPVTGLPGGATHIEVTASYSKGGANYFSGGTEPRGYWVIVKPVTVETAGSGVSWKKYTLFDKNGFKIFLKPAARFHAPTLVTLSNKVSAMAEAVAALVAAGDKDGAAALLLPLKDAA